MGTNIYMRKIPKAERKKELMDLIAKQYQQRIDSIKDDIGRCPGETDRFLDEDIDLLRQQIYEEVHIGKCSHGWKFLFAPNPQFYQERKDSVLAFIHSEDWILMDESGEAIDPDKFWEEYVVSQEKGFTLTTYQEWQIQHGEANRFDGSSYEHETVFYNFDAVISPGYHVNSISAYYNSKKN